MHECLCPHARAQSLLFVYRCSNTSYTCNSSTRSSNNPRRPPPRTHFHNSRRPPHLTPQPTPQTTLDTVTPSLPHHHPTTPQTFTPLHQSLSNEAFQQEVNSTGVIIRALNKTVTDLQVQRFLWHLTRVPVAAPSSTFLGPYARCVSVALLLIPLASRSPHPYLLRCLRTLVFLSLAPAAGGPHPVEQRQPGESLLQPHVQPVKGHR